jgi:hypothetical protein
MTAPRSATAVAKVLGVHGRFIRISCPFCGQQHAHPSASLGSQCVVALCHKPYQDLRTYAIPKPKKRN